MALTSLSEVCSGRRASGLVCAYTGRPLVILVSRSPQTGWRWFAAPHDPPPPSAPGSFYPNVPTLLAALSSRNGVPGCLTGESALFCPYTGHPLAIEKSPRGFFVTGGWSPFTPCDSLFKLEHFTRMRAGVPAPDTIPAPPRIVTEVKEEPEVLPKPAPSSKAQELAAELTDRFQHAARSKVTVSVPSPTARGRKEPAQ